jgi:integral membrane protein
MAGIADGVSLLVLLGIAMPLKYFAGMPLAVTIVGSLHGGIFVCYLLAILYAQLRLQWNAVWSLLFLLAAFVPFGNFVLDRSLKKRQSAFAIKPIPKVWLVYAIIFFTFIDLFTQLPVMSTYAASLGASAALAGFVVGLYSLTNTFGNILSGWLTDKYGAYIVLSVGLAATSGSLLSYSLVEHTTGLVIVRFIHGLLSGLIVPAAFTYAANTARKERQGHQGAITGIFVGIAAIAGPAYSGIMASRTSVPFVFATVAAAGLVLFAATVSFLRSGTEHRAKEHTRKGKLILNKGMVQAFSGAFFLMFSQGALAYLLPLHVDDLGYSSRLSGTLLSTFGIVAVILFMMQSGSFLQKVPPVYRFSAGLGFMGLSQILIGQTSGMAGLYAVLTLYGVGFSFLFPAINTMLIQSTSQANRGQAYGYFYALFSLGVVAGSSGIGLVPANVRTQFLVTGIVLIAWVVFVLAIAVRTGRNMDTRETSP